MPTRGKRYIIETSAREDSVPYYTKKVKEGTPGALSNLARQSRKFTPGHDEMGKPIKKVKTGSKISKKPCAKCGKTIKK